MVNILKLTAKSSLSFFARALLKQRFGPRRTRISQLNVSHGATVDLAMPARKVRLRCC